MTPPADPGDLVSTFNDNTGRWVYEDSLERARAHRPRAQHRPSRRAGYGYGPADFIWEKARGSKTFVLRGPSVLAGVNDDPGKTTLTAVEWFLDPGGARPGDRPVLGLGVQRQGPQHGGPPRRRPLPIHRHRPGRALQQGGPPTPPNPPWRERPGPRGLSRGRDRRPGAAQADAGPRPGRSGPTPGLAGHMEIRIDDDALALIESKGGVVGPRLHRPGRLRQRPRGVGRHQHEAQEPRSPYPN